MENNRYEILPIAVALFVVITISSIFYCYFSGNSYIHVLISKFLEFKLVDVKNIATIVYGFIAILIGYFYFYKRIKIDEEKAKNDRVRSRLNYLYDELNRADEIIDIILSGAIQNEDDLNQSRRKLDNMLILFGVYLENHDKLIGFNSDELKSLLQVHSFISQSEIISERDLKELKESDLATEKLKYLDCIQEARTICLQKLESY